MGYGAVGSLSDRHPPSGRFRVGPTRAHAPQHDTHPSLEEPRLTQPPGASRTRPARLVLLRHGHTAVSPGVYFGSRLDPPLDRLGVEQAMAARGLLARIHPAFVLASPLLRTRETAALAAAGRAIVVEADIREQDMGAYTGLTWDQIKALGDDAARAWRVGAAAPGGEDARSMWQRSARVALAAAGRLKLGEDALLVSHSGPIRGLLASARGLGPAEARRFRVRHACPRSIRLTPGVIDRWRALLTVPAAADAPASADDMPEEP